MSSVADSRTPISASISDIVRIGPSPKPSSERSSVSCFRLVMTRFKLRFPKAEIVRWSSEYSYGPSDARLENEIGPVAKREGFLTRDQFLEIAEWKTPRSQSRCRKNDDDFV